MRYEMQCCICNFERASQPALDYTRSNVIGEYFLLGVLQGLEHVQLYSTHWLSINYSGKATITSQWYLQIKSEA
ncbi:unnamed protein product [Blumeria hordei]|uniref:Uncharacterized protein n=1 Tax=Blumeria hordei TaxID=2867405 RepID=A0A383UV19_BLUHO|nr:unnamed protein product [Blumeria hordei]